MTYGEEEKVINFMAVTGCEEEAARFHLEAHGWQLDLAVAQFLDGGGASSSRPARGEVEHEVRAPDRVKQQRLLDGEEEAQVAARPMAFADYQEKSGSLAKLFALPTKLMHSGEFQNARRDAKIDRKFLLVCVTDESHFGCVSMNRDVWADETVQAVVESQFVLWLRSHLDHQAVVYADRYDRDRTIPAEGDSRQQLFRVHPKHPHLAVVDPRTGRRLWMREGVVSAEQLVEALSDVCDRHSMDDAPRQPPPKTTTIPKPPEPSRPPWDGETLAPEPPDGALIQFKLVDKSTRAHFVRKRRFSESDTVATLFKFAQLETNADDAIFELRAGFPPKPLWPSANQTIAVAKLQNESIQMTLSK
ncbi:hypothetical protein CTAYLR_001125 [Chrysophaeum taylorii]|uniref:UAS domain-containing protein n=1 Tax=Chrysophaeum taylorii TaxID=2483200 RepID=A0AAD7UPC2_9STRA|nr:hypothetical protein CTAYLR_001125 [Chrysophaeum taylorii]